MEIGGEKNRLFNKWNGQLEMENKWKKQSHTIHRKPFQNECSFKCKWQNYKTLEDNIGGKSSSSLAGAMKDKKKLRNNY